MTCFTPRIAHITPVLMRLHWLPVKFRVDFKIALLVYKAPNAMAPSYMTELLTTKAISHYPLGSDDQYLLFIPDTKAKTLGDICTRCSVNLELVAIPHQAKCNY